MKKILAITSIRSDYDLLSGVYRLLHKDKGIELKLLVSGAHLSKTYGYSVKLIEKDGFDILAKIETLIDSDSKQSRLKTASLLLQNSIVLVVRYAPDLIIYCGDREDVLIGAMIGGYLGIPTLHFFAGDHATDGNVDNSIRHATAKLSSVHFVSLKEHKQRLLKMGETAKRIFVIGNPALDKFYDLKGPSSNQILSNEFGLSVKQWREYAILIFHPLFGQEKHSRRYIRQILHCLQKKKVKTLISYPNTDGGNKDIIREINSFSTEHSKLFYAYKNLNNNSFVSLYKKAKFIIGNSSSGILESATVKIPAVNVGERQRGRKTAENVIFVKQDTKEILQAIDLVNSPDFREKVKKVKNPYGEGGASKRAYQLIKTIDFTSFILKKEDSLKL